MEQQQRPVSRARAFVPDAAVADVNVTLASTQFIVDDAYLTEQTGLARIRETRLTADRWPVDYASLASDRGRTSPSTRVVTSV